MYFPFMVDMYGRCVVVIGGGKVALRKCRLFLEYGACVSVVSPEFCEEFYALADRVELINDVYSEKYLAGAFVLVAASSNSEVNRSAADRAKALGILVNSVDDPPNCSFFIPAVVHRGDLTIGISTGGKSPALAAKLRRRLEQDIGPDYETYLDTLGDFRQRLLEMETDPKTRSATLIQAAELEPDALEEFIAQTLSKY